MQKFAIRKILNSKKLIINNPKKKLITDRIFQTFRNTALVHVRLHFTVLLNSIPGTNAIQEIISHAIASMFEFEHVLFCTVHKKVYNYVD